MKTTYIIPKAKNTETGEIVTHMELDGRRFAHYQQAVCQSIANGLAQKLSQRTNQNWIGLVAAVVTDHKA
jgi:hypothetical protein